MSEILMNVFFFKYLFLFWHPFFFRTFIKSFHRTSSNIITFTNQVKYLKYPSLLHRSNLNDHTLIFDVENALLKSSSMFPYFMLVAFEAGGLLRAIVLILLYPFVCLVGDEMGLKIMVIICFFGIKVENFRVGSAVLPKFFLEDVGSEMFEVLNRGAKKVGLSKLPRVMVESFLKEYLEIDVVVGREIKVLFGYYVGLMEEREKSMHALELVHERKGCCSNIIGISGLHKNIDNDFFFSCCKEVYVVVEGDKKRWQKLARDKYPKSLIFHDGRLALKPTPLDVIAILMWVPCGFIITIIRTIIALSFPYHILTPLLALSGFRLTTSMPKTTNNYFNNKCDLPKSHLYVCNHRTLFDPLYISFILRKDLVAVTYSLSKISELLAPIKTVRLTRNRSKDAKMMQQLLQQGDIVVCPEGTTCRENFLLRFSHLFSQICDEIYPIAIDSHVTMFHGTTAAGFKCMDPIFFVLNPFPTYSVQLLEKVVPSCVTSCDNNEDERFEVANQVQTQIGKALGFECTKLTRKDKYLILAGNEGIISSIKSDK
ncbi:putative glycerol-3-phosphate 1-O-acyltransferase [Lupinus albus]|uniref:Putative glycerol-3-phosphate 1-O-acyltransferase n=1 Tax=Lupinus albus TaxID=3870 RepID=A0A6A4QQB8_LUPAL|nr:putative glycerol-3-phosphate 1-O-acyltransferase [Lupinus albus]